MKQVIFIEQITILSNAFRCDVPKEGSLKVYWKHLKDISDEKFIKICDEIIKTERFFPAISVFLNVGNKEIGPQYAVLNR